jgi:hypothetical protein
MQQSNTVEFRLQMKGDASQASAAVRGLTQDTQRLSQTALAAERDLARMNQSARTGGYGPPQAGQRYGLSAPTGTSAAHAYAGSYQPAMPTWQPGAYAGPRGGTPAGMPRPGGGADGVGDLIKVGMIAGAVTKVVEALDRFAHGLDRAAVTTGPGGQRLTSGAGYRLAATDAYTSLPFTQTIGNIHDWYATSDFPGNQAYQRMFGMRTGEREHYREALYQSQVEEATQGPRWDMQRRLTEVGREARGYRQAAHGSAATAAAMRGGLAEYAADYELYPELAGARLGVRGATAGVDEAKKVLAGAQAEAAQRVNEAELAGARRDRERAAANREAWRTPTAGLYPTDKFADQGARQGLMNAEAEAAEKAKRAQDALNIAKKAGLDLAEKQAALAKATADEAQAKLATNRQNTEQQRSGLLGFAGMDYWGQRSVVDVAKKWKEQGPGALLPDEVNLIMPYLTPKNQQKLVEATLNNSSGQNFNQAQGYLGQDTLEQLRQQAFDPKDPEAGLIYKAQFKLTVDDALIKAQLADFFQGIGAKIQEMIRAEGRATISRVEEMLQMQKAGQGGG